MSIECKGLIFNLKLYILFLHKQIVSRANASFVHLEAGSNRNGIKQFEQYNSDLRTSYQLAVESTSQMNASAGDE